MKILLGDDHMLFRAGLRGILEQLRPDAVFTEVGSYDDLIAHCQGGVRHDIILMDLHMPGWPGFDGILKVRELQPDTPVVVVSASDDVGNIRAAVTRGAAGYVPKTSSAKVMSAAIDLILSGGVYLPPKAILPPGPEHKGHLRTTMDEEPVVAGTLTPRQRDVLRCLRQGKSNKQIATELGLTEGTIKVHLTSIFRFLGVKNRTQAAMALNGAEP